MPLHEAGFLISRMYFVGSIDLPTPANLHPRLHSGFSIIWVMIKTYRIFGTCVVWAAILTRYVIRLFDGSYGGFASATIGYLSYFTILTNILVGLAFTAPLLSEGNKLRLFFEKPAVRAAIALYITVVMAVYWAVLAPIHNPVGISAITNVGLHLIVPILYILDWVLFSKKDKMSFKRIPYWILYPVAYGIYTIIRGSVTGDYPYPFMNVTELGMGRVFINMLGFAGFYAVGAAVFIALGRRLGNPKIAEEYAA